MEGLQGVEPGEVLALGNAQRFRDLPGLPVGTTDVTYLALGNESVESAQGFLQRRDGSVP